MTGDDFSSVRRDPDPLRRGRRATELLIEYQQRATELARLRRAAIEEAHRDQGMSYTEIAQALGITKGRVTQIRGSAPGPERAFFGVGPIKVGLPYRYQTTDRERPLIAAEDARAAEQIEALVGTLGFAHDRFQIEPDQQALPSGDAVVICGPKSSPSVSELLSRDPVLSFVESDGRWSIQRADTGEMLPSPMDDDESTDLAYVARHVVGDNVVIHIAGIHALGSLGAVHYLTRHLGPLFEETVEEPFSCVIRASFDGLAVKSSSLEIDPIVW